MTLDEQFAVVVCHNEGQPLVRLNGEIDMLAAPTLRQTLTALLDVGEHEISLDLGDVSFMDSTALGAIVETVRDGAWITIVAASPCAQRLLEVSGVAELCTQPDATNAAGADCQPSA